MVVGTQSALLIAVACFVASMRHIQHRSQDILLHLRGDWLSTAYPKKYIQQMLRIKCQCMLQITKLPISFATAFDPENASHPPSCDNTRPLPQFSSYLSQDPPYRKELASFCT